MLRKNIYEFVAFVRDKGVVGLAIGIIIGGAVTQLVNALIQDIVNPVLSAITGKIADFEDFVYRIPGTLIELKVGDFISNLITFLTIVAVVYFVFMKMPILRDIDKKKEETA